MRKTKQVANGLRVHRSTIPPAASSRTCNRSTLCTTNARLSIHSVNEKNLNTTRNEIRRATQESVRIHENKFSKHSLILSNNIKGLRYNNIRRSQSWPIKVENYITIFPFAYMQYLYHPRNIFFRSSVFT